MSRFGQLSAPQIALIVAVLTLGSKFIGFVREIIMANYYGTSYVVDSFSISGSIPNMIFAGILAATATSFMPLFSEKMEREGERSANLFTSQTINILVIVCAISSFIGIVFSHQIVTIFTMPETAAPAGADTVERIGWFLTHGWTGERAQLTSSFINITFSYGLFSTVAGILESYIKYKGVFIRQVVAGYAISLCVIVGILASKAFGDPRLIMWGSFAGIIIRLLVIVAISRRKNFRYTPDFRMNDTVRRIFAMALPVFVGASFEQVSAFVDNTLASGLPEGNVASLAYAGLITGLASGLTASVIATIIYPKLSQAYAQRDEGRFSDLFTNGLTIALMLGIPLAIAAFIYSDPVIQIVYERGAFSGNSTELTGRAMHYLSIGLAFIMAQGVMVGAFHSRQNMKTPLVIGVAAITVNIVLDLLLVGRYGNAGLAFATSMSQVAGAVLFAVAIRRKNPGLVSRGFVVKCLKVLLASAVSVVCTSPVYYLTLLIAAQNGWSLPRSALLLAAAACAFAAYAALLRLMKVEELKHFREIAGLLGRRSS